MFVVEAQATVEQPKVHEAEMTQGKADEATGGVGRPEGEGIDQAFSRFFWTHAPSPSLHRAMPCFNLHIKICRNT